MSRPDECGARLIAGLCIMTGAKVVISSTWRLREKDCFDLLDQARLDRHFICDCAEHEGQCWKTPNRGGGLRGYEIQGWLMRHPEVTHYVIFDDNSDFTDEQESHLVQTSFDNGILMEDFNEAHRILMAEPEPKLDPAIFGDS